MLKWYIFVDNNRFGPFSERFLYELFKLEQIDASTFIQAQDVEEKLLITEALNLSDENLNQKLAQEIIEEQRKQDLKHHEVLEEYLTLLSLGMPESDDFDFPEVPDFTQSKERSDLPEFKEKPSQTDIKVPEFKDPPELPISDEDLINEILGKYNEEKVAEVREDSLTQEVNLAQFDLDKIENDGPGELTQEVQLAQFNLDKEDEIYEAGGEEPDIEIEIIGKPKKPMNKFILFGGGGFLFCVFVFVIVMFLSEDPDYKSRSIVENKTINKEEKKLIKKIKDFSFEKSFVKISKFEKYPMLKTMISDKSRGMELLIDGEILRNKQCYIANLFSLNSKYNLPESIKFEVNKIIKKYPKKVKFFKYKCVKHTVEASLYRDLGFGEVIDLNIYYCPTFVDKVSTFKRKYGLSQKCYGLKDFDSCWNRVSESLINQRPTELIEKDNVASDYIELVTFITHENFRIENSDGMKTLKKCN